VRTAAFLSNKFSVESENFCGTAFAIEFHHVGTEEAEFVLTAESAKNTKVRKSTEILVPENFVPFVLPNASARDFD
jgi:hypothetical protein